MSDALKRFTTNLKSCREELGLSQEEVALRAGMHPAAYNRIERGRVDPRVKTVARLAKALGVDASRLLLGVTGP